MNFDIIKNIKMSFVVAFALSVVFLFIDYKISLSILVGNLFSVWHLSRLSRNIDKMLGRQSAKGTYFNFTTDVILLTIPFMLVVMFPELFHFIGMFIGLMINKIIIYATNIRRKG